MADIIAKTLINIATTYTGEEGRKRLEALGYSKSMLDAMEGAGTKREL